MKHSKDDKEAIFNSVNQKAHLMNPLRALHQTVNIFNSARVVRNIFEEASTEEAYLVQPKAQLQEIRAQSLEKSQKKARKFVRTSMRTEVSQDQAEGQQFGQSKLLVTSKTLPEPKQPAQSKPSFFYEEEESEQQNEESANNSSISIDYHKESAAGSLTSRTSNQPEDITFNVRIAACQLLEESRAILNSLLPYQSTTFKLVRRKNTIYTTFSLVTYDHLDVGEKRFLMATRNYVSLSETHYPVSGISKVKKDVVGSAYEVGHMDSDFSRNSYTISSYRTDGPREVTVTFDDVMFGARQVKLQVHRKGQEKPDKYWNLPESVLSVYDKDMVGSKRNIIVARSKPINDIKQADLALRLRKVGPDSFLLTIQNHVTPLEAFCFSVAHLDRQA